MPDAYLAPSLARFRTSINTRWPNRDKGTDGWIGDAAHQSRTSDHNKDPKTGVVRALDVDKDRLHVPTLIAAGLLHDSIRYVIYNRRIMHVDNLFRPKRYTGSNPHTAHVHFSIEHTRTAENSKADWVPVSKGFSWPTIKPGQRGTAVRQLQAYLNGHGHTLDVDGRFEDGTLSAVRSFQARHGLDVDGWVGPQTQSALRTK
jgi:Putative peptidoglycan binding domain